MVSLNAKILKDVVVELDDVDLKVSDVRRRKQYFPNMLKLKVNIKNVMIFIRFVCHLILTKSFGSQNNVSPGSKLSSRSFDHQGSVIK